MAFNKRDISLAAVVGMFTAGPAIAADGRINIAATSCSITAGAHDVTGEKGKRDISGYAPNVRGIA
ncbi:hypothetical protein [Burkholderia cenocepacia]|uniref:hypothetical protein n=1 Tax=Burkholderia cenocepacia TaxID=95486 RepID=UPI0039A72D80